MTDDLTDGAAASALSEKARRLRNTIEPLASNVYFAPDVHAEFEALGFGPATGGEGYVTLAEVSGYYCSRAGCMGQVPGEVVVAAFGVFNPDLIIPAVERGWSIAGVDEVLAARERGATASLQRILGTPDELPWATGVMQRAAAAGGASGRFLYAGLRSLGIPSTPWGAAWRAIDTVREHRGDSHIAAWLAAGLDRGGRLLTEVYYGCPPSGTTAGVVGLIRSSTPGSIGCAPRDHRRRSAGAHRGRSGAAREHRGGHRSPAAPDHRGDR